jgi:integrase
MDTSPQNRKANLTDRLLKSLKPAPKGQRYTVYDTGQPGLSVRVTDSGKISFVHGARLPGQKLFTKFKLGGYPGMTVEAARAKVQERLRAISQGDAPAVAEARLRRVEMRSRVHLFAPVARQYIADWVKGPDFPANPKLRTWRRVERDFENFLIPEFGARPIAEIDDEEIAAFLDKKGSKLSTVWGYFSNLKCMFDWAIEKRCFGIRRNPCAGMRVGRMFGTRSKRRRMLNEAELRAFWKCAIALPYPEGPAYQMLGLAALRLNEVAGARWSEFNMRKREWLIPAERMKGKNGKAEAHLVPITDAMMELLQSLPRFNEGDHLFSRSNGVLPVQMGSKAKKLIDKAMLAELKIKAFAEKWTNHDIRRTVRSWLPRLKIGGEVSERILAHALPGIIGVYNVHDYADEKREALETWGRALNAMLDPAPVTPDNGNIVRMRKRA